MNLIAMLSEADGEHSTLAALAYRAAGLILLLVCGCTELKEGEPDAGRPMPSAGQSAAGTAKSAQTADPIQGAAQMAGAKHASDATVRQEDSGS